MVDPENSAGQHGLAVTFLRKGKFEEAAEACLTTVGLKFHTPLAHYHLAEALLGMEQWVESAQAFEVCLSMAPRINKARQELVKLYNEKLNLPEKANEHKEFMEENTTQTITVVSGLPRSGTSMMMQMLEKAGLEIYTDKKRVADDHNPKGYYEHDNVKALTRDKKWLPEAVGKVAKVIAPLLYQLPPRFNYKVIFMERDIGEVIMSQQKMLAKGNPAKEKIYPVGLEQAFKKYYAQLDLWIENNTNAEVLRVPYTEVIANPEKWSDEINQFLGGVLAVEEMVEVVEPGLYRTKMEGV